jgi:nucleotide-binding universal stress UspA family protein
MLAKEVAVTHLITRPVAVGVDGSAGARAAVDWAAQEASRRHAPLHLIHGFDLEPAGYITAGHPTPEASLSAPLHAGRRMLADTASDYRQRYPDLCVSTVFSVGSPAWLLVEQSKAASMVVVGARRRGGFAGLLAGSVTTRLAAHAYGPVVVVRGHPDDEAGAGRPVVAGVDGSVEAAAALAFAIEEAAERGSCLVAVHVWPAMPMSAPGQIAPWHYDRATAARSAERLMLDQLTGWHEKYPDVNVVPRMVHGFDPGRALIAASQRASLMVVGSHGRGGFAGMPLGSVSRALVHHAACPVAVVRPEFGG